MFWQVHLKKGRGRYSCLHFRTRTTPSKPRCACRSQSLPIWNILFWPSPTKPLWSWLRSSDTSWRRQDSQPRLCSHLEKHVSNSKCCRDYRCDFNTADKQIRTRINVQICLRVTKKFASDFDTHWTCTSLSNFRRIGLPDRFCRHGFSGVVCHMRTYVPAQIFCA